MQKCEQAAQAIGMPPTALLAGLLMIVGFAMSHSVVEVEGTDWMEPVLLWLSVCMPTGSGKSSLCKLLRQIVKDAREQCGLREDPISWTLDDQSFEKMGELMQDNHGKLLGLYDELPMFLAQVNICRGRALADSQQVAIFLQLYGADSWVRRTGMLPQCECWLSKGTAVSVHRASIYKWSTILAFLLRLCCMRSTFVGSYRSAVVKGAGN